MSIHEIPDDPEKEHRPIARPDRSSELIAHSSKEILRLPRGFTDLDLYMAMMRRLNRSRHKRKFRHWGPGGHKEYVGDSS